MSDEDEDEGAKVIPLRADPERRPPIAYAGPTLSSYCAHRSTEVDIAGRRLTCLECARDLDPYQYLGSLLHECDYNDAVRTKKQLCKEIEVLTKERQRLRDAVNRLKRKDGA